MILHTTQELDDLPLFATVEDRDNWVYQKMPGFHRAEWFTPGIEGGFKSDTLRLPVRILDDGL